MSVTDGAGDAVGVVGPLGALRAADGGADTTVRTRSMGGHAALTYAFTSRQKITAVQANCPVCDLPFHYTERVDLPRTMHHAFGSTGDISTTLRAKSPLHQVAKLPDVPYQIIHGGKDTAVGKVQHSDPLVAAMRGRGLRVEYLEEPEMRHCGPLTNHALHRRMVDFVLEQLPPAV